MTPTDFAVHVTTFLTQYLAAQRNLSPKTIQAYREVLTLLRRSCRDIRGMALEKLSRAQIDVALGEAFLQYLEQERQAAIGTRHQRLAALHAFFRSVQAEQPQYLWPCQQILALPLRRYARPPVGYLSKDLVAALLAQPDLNTHDGRRDAVFLRVLYDTGARVQEVIDLSAGDVRLEPPAQVHLMGKGRKSSCCVTIGARTVWTVLSPMIDRSSRTGRANASRVRGDGISCTSMSRRSAVRILASRTQ